jgi:hypothetical protein
MELFISGLVLLGTVLETFKVQQVQREQLVPYPLLQVLLVQRDQQVLQEQLELKEMLEQLEQLVQLEILVQQDRLAQLVQLQQL